MNSVLFSLPVPGGSRGFAGRAARSPAEMRAEGRPPGLATRPPGHIAIPRPPCVLLPAGNRPEGPSVRPSVDLEWIVRRRRASLMSELLRRRRLATQVNWTRRRGAHHSRCARASSVEVRWRNSLINGHMRWKATGKCVVLHVTGTTRGSTIVLQLSSHSKEVHA